MVRMNLHILILLCVVNICFTHSLQKGCSDELHHLCYNNHQCIFENSLTCDYKCRVPWQSSYNRVFSGGGRHYKRSVPLQRDDPPPVADTYLHLHLNSKQPQLGQELLEDLASNITTFFKWPADSITDCQEKADHLTCAVVGLNPVLVSTDLALESNIDKITPILVDSVGTSNKNASMLAEEEEESSLGTIISQKMSLSDVMIWVFGAVLFLLLISLFLVYLVQRRQSGHKTLTNENESGSSELYYDYENLVRSRIQDQPSSQHRPPNLTQHQVSKQWSSSSVSEEKVSPQEYIGQKMDIQSAHLALSYMEQYHTNTDKIEREWERLCRYEPEMKQADIGRRSEDVSKNRFSTVLPFDHNRVKLSNLHASDYINASYVYTESPKTPTYIASQGPLQNCTGDFWQMVWEQGISEIIMLSLNDGVDCFQYWESDGNGVYYHYQLHLVSEHANHPDYPDYVVRSFYLKNLQTYETRTVTQFHYVAWLMSSSTPRSTQSLLDFRRKVHKSYRGLSAPLLVHCNDGIGRTGTYLLLDMTLSRICKGVKEVDMEAAVEHLRDQRAGMVVTKEQYAFALSAVVEEIHNILGEMPSPKSGQFTGPNVE